MARVKIEEIVDHLDGEFKKALVDTTMHFAPGVQFDRGALFRFFLQRVYHHCSSWKSVPDSAVEP